ncbi:MAG TPA: hypothetical protein DEO89_11000, partial [Lachnospiraceae bacterium]|nr:hypothetical protein [Lachnospiraceae bacterium]
TVFSGYDGYEIAQVELERGIEENLSVCEEKRRGRYATLMLAKNGKEMAMKLIYPKENVRQIPGSPMEEPRQMQTTEIQSEGAGKQSWSADDIQNFTKAVGDTNSIHQGEQAIVPGLLMMETMIFELEEKEIPWKKIKMRFYKPVAAVQPVQIIRQEEEVSARTKEEQICWKMWLS